MNDALIEGAAAYHVNTYDPIFTIQVKSNEVFLGLMLEEAEGIEYLE